MSVTYQKKPGFKTTSLEALNGADLSGKVALVTGGNSGLGLETVKTLSIGGAKVYLLCRNTQSGEEARESIKSDKLKGEIIVDKVDTTDFENISSFVSKLLSTEKRIDFVVLNAGVMACPFERTKHGFEKQIGTNYYGHYYFVQKLLPFMKKQDFESRIVLVSSVAHMFGDVDLDDINYQKRKYGSWKSYGQSKTAIILWGRFLAKQLKDSKVLVFSLHPGGIMTNLQRYQTTGVKWLDNALMGGLGNMFLFFNVFKTIPQGAATSIYACVAKELEDKSGEYLEDCHVTKSAAYANDMSKAENLVKITDEHISQVEKKGEIN